MIDYIINLHNSMTLEGVGISLMAQVLLESGEIPDLIDNMADESNLMFTKFTFV